MADVKTTFFASEADAVAAINRLERKYEQLEAKIGDVGKAARRGAEDGVAAVGAWGAKLATIAAGFLSIRSAIGFVIDANRQFAEQADQAALKYDKFFRRFQVQSGQNALQTEAMQKKIRANRIRTAVSAEFAQTLSSELVGEGFSPEEAAGGSGLALMEAAQATGGFEQVDPKQIAQATAMILNAKGMEKTEANVRKLMVGVQRLYKETSFRLEDMIDLAAKLEVTGAKTPLDQDLATFDLLRQEMPADVGATGFKIFFDRLQTIKGRPSDVALLRRIGLKPADVDLVGEDLDTVLERLADGLSKVPENIQNMVLSGIFEERGRLAASLLIRRRKELPALRAKMGDVLGFEKDVAVATSGKAAAAEREKAIKEEADAAEDSGFYRKLAAADDLVRKKGAGAVYRNLAWYTAVLTNAIPLVSDEHAIMGAYGYDTRNPYNITPEELAQRRAEMESPGGSKANERLIETNEKMLDELKEMNKKLDRPVGREGRGAP